MKGVILKCIAELVESKFGRDKWEAILEQTGLPKDTTFLIGDTVDDGKTMKAVESLCNVLDLNLQQVGDAFGEYWMCEFAPRLYKGHYKGINSAKEFILKMDDVHTQTTKTIADAKPPEFTYKWKDDNTLIMGYKSHRGLIDIMVGLIRGVGKYYKDDLEVTKISDKEVEIKFK